jgi:glucose dehydrogenase
VDLGAVVLDDERDRALRDNVAVFRNFGIVANRGVAYCGRRLFLATLDMHLVALRLSDGQVLARVPVSSAVPGAASNYGNSQTSTPICAKNILVMGAAGSEYGIRGYVMGWHTDLTPAWANPFWTNPPEQTEWRSRGRLVGGGAVWTPVSIDPTTNTVYFGTGIDRIEHPSLKPGQPVTVFPASIGGLNFWPASYDPQTNYLLNAAAETGAVLQQATPANGSGSSTRPNPSAAA